MSISTVRSTITKSSNTIDLYQGESKDLELTIVEEVADVNGVLVDQPVDLTGAVIHFSVRSKASSPDLLIGKDSTIAANIEIGTPATKGIAIIHLVPLDTKNLQPGEYVFDVWIRLSSGKTIPVVEISEFIVKEAVTKLP